MSYKVGIIILAVCIILSGCGKLTHQKKTMDDVNNNNNNSESAEPSKLAISNGDICKTIISDEKYNASIYYDKGFYFKVDSQILKIKDDDSDSQDIIADEFEFPRPKFSLYSINNDNLYFIIKLLYPTNGTGSSASSWFIMYKNNSLTLLGNYSPYDFNSLMLPESVEYESIQDGMIKFTMPDLNKEYRMTPTNPEYSRKGDRMFFFSVARDISIEKNLIIFDTILKNYDSHSILTGGVSLVFSINETGLELVDLSVST